MSSQDGASAIAWSGDCTAATGRPSAHDFAMLEEISFVRREAQAEAELAYEDWRCLPSEGRYAVYRAAQDRADAAQDDLARLSDRIAA
jgi:acyl-CoA reductase-like NAD-dependent aldehyde dehydrogenase